MRQTLLVMASVAVFSLLCVPDAWAGVTCQIIPGMCPPPQGGPGPHAVPEPGTLALLAAGAGAVGAALRRARRKR